MIMALTIITAAILTMYLVSVAVTIWFYSLPVNYISRPSLAAADYHHADVPTVVLLYPVLNELKETMRSAFVAMEKAPYPDGKRRVIAIPNESDTQTTKSLESLKNEFAWLEIWPVPATTDPSWETVWNHWEANDGAYWWHTGKRAGERKLPAKKTRQLVWAMYTLANQTDASRTILSYTDADSLIPEDYWYSAAVGHNEYDVVQSINLTGNALATWAASFHAMDHIGWDATLYPHMTANGKHPFYVLGKGLFYKLDQLVEIGGFHPWLTIEDPEIGLRLWTRGKRMGMMHSPLVEEVPATWGNGFTQRKRWMAGFFQTQARPLRMMGMPLKHRIRARLNLVPVVSFLINPLALASAIASTTTYALTGNALPGWLNALSLVIVLTAIPLLLYRWYRAWVLMEPIFDTRRRIRFILRVNPIFTIIYGFWWIGPIVRGLVMWLLDQGLVWERTKKVDANHELARSKTSGDNTTSGTRARTSR